MECGVATSKVINLSEIFGKGDETDKFVTRYLQTTHCDLFFADAAILIEGFAENILLPHFIRLHYPKLNQKYIFILSINGRHAHRLNPLIQKLCLPTLVIADLDPGESAGHHKSVLPERKKNIIGTNYTITDWLLDEKSLDKLIDLPAKQKIIYPESVYKYPIRVAYQTPIPLTFNGTKAEALSGTFEDCLIYTNLETFKTLSVKDAGSLVKRFMKQLVKPLASRIFIKMSILFCEMAARIRRLN